MIEIDTGLRGIYQKDGQQRKHWSSAFNILGHNGLGVPVSRHEKRIEGKGIGEKSVRVHDYNVPMKAHFEILQQASVVSPYVDMDKKELLVACNILGRSKAWI